MHLAAISSNSPENLQIIANAQLNKFRDPVLSPKPEPKQQKICILQQFSDNSPENLQRIKMLSSIKLEVTDISTNFETQAAEK